MAALGGLLFLAIVFGAFIGFKQVQGHLAMTSLVIRMNRRILDQAIVLELIQEITCPVRAEIYQQLCKGNITFTQHSLDTIICKKLNIDLDKFVTGKARGTKPTKLAIKLGADVNLAQLYAGLLLGTTKEEINSAFADETVKSCITGKPVGNFYSYANVGVIYGNNFRLLVNLVYGDVAPRAYGFHMDKVDLGLPVIPVGSAIVAHAEHELFDIYLNKLEFRPYLDYNWYTDNI